MNKKIYILVGPSASGTDTLLKEARISNLEYAIKATTRKKREGEKEGEKYIFVTDEQYKDLQSKGEIIHSWKSDWGDSTSYGLLKRQLNEKLSQGKKLLTTTHSIREVNELKNILNKNYSDIKIYTVFIYVSEETIKHRLSNRSPELVNIRLKQDLNDLNEMLVNKDKFDFILDNNGTVEEGVEKLQNIIK